MNMELKTLVLGLGLLLSGSTMAQQQESPFYYFMIGHWRSGPEVILTPPLSGDETKTMEQLKQDAISMFEELKGIKDMDVVVEPNEETAWSSIEVLKLKYARRELSVRVLEQPSPTEE
jgi:hypothetical protein